MQFIEKQNIQPPDWDKWFTTGSGQRSFDYGKDYSSLRNIGNAKKFLIDEQHELCAYCQKIITIENSSIEHIIPKEHNKVLSTNYHNLVAVCKVQSKEEGTDRYHCDKEKLSNLISPIIFVKNSDVSTGSNNRYFLAGSDGTINAKDKLPTEIRQITESFIEVLNLNHKTLKENRVKDVLNGLIAAYQSIPRTNKQGKKAFWKLQFDRILLNKKQPFRQFLLIYIGSKIGIN